MRGIRYLLQGWEAFTFKLDSSLFGNMLRGAGWNWDPARKPHGSGIRVKVESMRNTNRFAAVPGPRVRSGFLGRLGRTYGRTYGRVRAGDEDGQALVEFALTLPMLLTVVTAIFIFAIALSHYMMLLNAVTIGAQSLAISRGNTTDPCSLVATTVEAAAPSLTPGSLTFSLNLNGTAESGTTCSSASTSTGAAGDLVAGGSAQVTVTYPCSLVIYNVNPWPSCKLVATIVEAVQ